MIKLNKGICPPELTPEFVLLNTAAFKAEGNSVWNLDWLKEALLSLSFNKCAYCECDLKEESKYMEVDHFEDKAHNPDKVLEWSNLVPSCKRCNGSKGTHDVIAEPIINPFVDTPSNHLFFRLYRLKGSDSKGRNTVGAVNLNHTERAVKKRFDIGEALQNLIDNARDRLDRYEEDGTALRRNKLRNIVEATLKECQPNAIYAATCATILHSNEVYNQIRDAMIRLEIWDNELQTLHGCSRALCL